MLSNRGGVAVVGGSGQPINAPMPVSDYLSYYAEWFDTRCFAEIGQEVEASVIRNQLGEEEHTLQGAWVKL